MAKAVKDKILELIAKGTPAAARKLAELLGTELARVELASLAENEATIGADHMYYVGMKLNDYIDDNDEGIHGEIGHLSSILSSWHEDKLVDGLLIKYEGSNQEQTADGSETQEAYGVYDGDKLLALFRIEGWYSSYEGTEWSPEATVFVDKYAVRKHKFYTAKERQTLADDFI